MKFAAVFLGPAGVGLMSAYTTILAPLALAAGMGITSSGVRQIAEAAGENDRQRIARTTLAVRRISRLCGVFALVLTLLLAYPLSVSMFGDGSHAFDLSVLSVTLFLGALTGGLGAILQGLRRIRDMATKTALDALFGLPVALALMALWGTQAIVPILCATALLSLAITWWFVRRVEVEPIRMSWHETWIEALPMLKLGLVFMSSGLVATGVAYLIRLLIIRLLGLEASGAYSAAWTLSSYYVGFILSAMGADFYPRLTGVNKNNAEVNRMVNEQTEVGLLIALPGIFATLGLAPLVIRLFYTAEFLSGVELLQWQVLGVLLRVVSWPMGYILLAKSAKWWFFVSELAANTLLLSLTWFGIKAYGLNGAGVGLLAMYAGLCIWIYFIASHLTGFTWSRTNIRLIATAIISSSLAFAGARLLPTLWNACLGTFLAVASAWYSLRALSALTGQNPLAAIWERAHTAVPILGDFTGRRSNSESK
jgi:PST family polysaccharide transporter